MITLSAEDLRPLFELAFMEDINTGDITSEAVFGDGDFSRALITAKQDGIICGVQVLEYFYGFIDPEVVVRPAVRDGEAVKSGRNISEIYGHTISVLKGERTALNFMQRMSGIATAVSAYAGLLEGGNIKILDTRKTVPGLRRLDKYAVACGGGNNHRMGLYDMVMIKDNHIKAAGGIDRAVKAVREAYRSRYKIEVEASTPAEAREAAECGADIVMLDNMEPGLIRESIDLIGGRSQIEVSGNISPEKIEALRSLKIDYISVGALTHSVKAFDLSMKFID